MVREVAHARKRNPLSDLIKFCKVVGIPDLITCANFGEDRLRGLGVAGSQNLPFSIDFDRRPCNTLALPCECVMRSIATDEVAWSVCRSVCHDCEPGKNSLTDQDTVWCMDLGGRRDSCIRCGSRSPYRKGHF